MKPVLIQKQGQIGILELNRPEKFNALSSEVFATFTEALSRFEADSDVRVLLLRAAGKHFCTGADLQEIDERRRDLARYKTFLERGLQLLDRFEKSSRPVIASVQGLCLAGGLELVLACDVVFCTRSARFGDQHAKFGLFPGLGGSQRLARLIGLRRSLDLMMSGRWIDAGLAHSWGLVNYVVEDGALEAETLAYCKILAGHSHNGLAAMKAVARQGFELPLADALRLETERAVELMGGCDASEGLDAFAKRRVPRFVGALPTADD